jgi:hypothetical protein
VVVVAEDDTEGVLNWFNTASIFFIARPDREFIGFELYRHPDENFQNWIFSLEIDRKKNGEFFASISVPPGVHLNVSGGGVVRIDGVIRKFEVCADFCSLDSVANLNYMSGFPQDSCQQGSQNQPQRARRRDRHREEPGLLFSCYLASLVSNLKVFKLKIFVLGSKRWSASPRTPQPGNLISTRFYLGC